MTKPESPENGSVFDLTAIAGELREEPAYERSGHTARTLVRMADLRVVLIAVKAGARIAEHQANETASIQVVSGRVRVGLADRAIELAAGQLAVLEPGLEHDVEARTESAFVLTLGWSGKD